MKENIKNTNIEDVHWADFGASNVLRTYPNKDVYNVASGVTPSGIVHVGHFREIITTELVRRSLERKGKKTKFIYSWDSYDAFRKVPKNIPSSWDQYLRLPNCSVPDPWECHNSYGEHWIGIAEKSLSIFNFPIEYQRQDKLQTSGIYADSIKDFLKARDEIKILLNKYKTNSLPDNWFPLSVFCEKCGKDTTKISNYDEMYTLDYVCDCGYKNTINFKETPIVKLPWRLDWPMRWNYYDISFEPGGKDHSSPGSSYDTGKDIIKSVCNRPAPVYIFYTNVRMKGQGGKVSSSAGNGATLDDVLSIYTPEIIMFLFAGTRPNSEFDISFDLDVIKIYEDFDKLERVYYGIETENNPKKLATQKRIYELSMPGGIEIQKEIPFQPSFRMLTAVLQCNDFNFDKVKDYYKDKIKTKFEENRLKERFECAVNWIKNYAPDEMKFCINKKINIELNNQQKNVIKSVIDSIKKTDNSKDLFLQFKEIAQSNDISVSDFFVLMYSVIISKEKGPKLAEFIIDNKEKVLNLLNQVYN